MCTRVVYQGLDGMIVTARSMDWAYEIPANLWVFPRGMQRNGMVGPNSVTWTSKYGSVVASAYNIASADGMNEKGLVANLLWLAESRYPDFTPDKQGLSIAAWVQYVLDNFATVEETVEALQAEPFVIVSSNIPGTTKFGTLHLSISDASGNNAIFEYIDGKLVIHVGMTYTVMTNSPTFEHQLALNEYWKDIGGLVMLPGTNRAADRFVRASYYINAIPKTSDTQIAVASAFSVIRNVSVPLGISTPDQPNISTTRWRSVADQKNLLYFFETTITPNVIWFDLKKANLEEGSPVKRLQLENYEIYSGETSDYFEADEPFDFAGL
jgi:penicillin V acylase-like amidase (Ntn superfamily)